MARARIIYVSGGKKFYIDDVEVTQAEFDKRFPSKIADLLKSGKMLAAHSSGAWPMKSEGLACHPSQVAEITERNKRHGITGVSYEPDGTAVLADRGARRDLLKLEGFHDKNSFMGD